jgi:MFS family permease
MQNEATGSIDDDLREMAARPAVSRGLLARAFRSLRHRNYRLYFFGQLISLTGSWVQTTALMWLAYDLTRQSRWPAGIVALHIFPTFLLGPWGGVLADRVSKRWLIFGTQAGFMVSAVMLATLTLTGLVRPWHLVVLATLSGVVNAIDLPARLAFVMDLVGREDLMNAVGLNASLFNAARAVGPALGGLLLAWLSPGVCFLVNSTTYVGVLSGLLLMDVCEPPRAAAAHGGLRSVLEGFRYLAGQPRLAALLSLVGVVSFFGWPFQTLLPALARDVLHTGETGYSLLLSGTGLGALTAALSVATFGSLERRRWFIASGVGTAGASLFGLGLGGTLWSATPCCVLIGFGLILCFATSQSVLQLRTEDYHRGRVMGIWSMILCGTQPLGNLIAGFAADHWDERVVLAASGVACVIAAAGMVWTVTRTARNTTT